MPMEDSGAAVKLPFCRSLQWLLASSARSLQNGLVMFTRCSVLLLNAHQDSSAISSQKSSAIVALKALSSCSIASGKITDLTVVSLALLSPIRALAILRQLAGAVSRGHDKRLSRQQCAVLSILNPTFFWLWLHSRGGFSGACSAAIDNLRIERNRWPSS